jgi:hypothetical protein
MPAGESLVLVVSVWVTPEATGSLVNVARVESSTLDPVMDNNLCIQTVTVAP